MTPDFSSHPTQLTLGISLDDDARFENFVVTEGNRQLLASLQGGAEQEPFVYLWGGSGVGRTHLLQATCHAAGLAGHSAIYIPLADRDTIDPAILTGAHTLDLVCLDDVHLLAGDSAWEAALFTAFNAMRDSHTRLVVTAAMAPGQLPVHLPDLLSRLNTALVYQIQPLDDAEKLDLLIMRAGQRGIRLDAKVADYILIRAERDLNGLMGVLDKLDASSLAQQRKLTIPLVKSTMGW